MCNYSRFGVNCNVLSVYFGGDGLLEHSLVVGFALLVAPIMTCVYTITDRELELHENCMILMISQFIIGLAITLIGLGAWLKG